MKAQTSMTTGSKQATSNAAGFSLIELMISMTLTLVVVGLASSFIAESFRLRNREDQRTVAMANVQRALNLITREIANTGFGLTTNGIVAGESTAASIRIRTDLNNDDTVVNEDGSDAEDVMFLRSAEGTLVRAPITSPATTPSVLAENIDAFNVHYYASRVDYTTVTNDEDGNLVCDITTTDGTDDVANVADAEYIVLSVCVSLPAVGTPGSNSYQPPSTVQMVSDVMLRNKILSQY